MSNQYQDSMDPVSHLRTKMGIGILHRTPLYLTLWLESAIDIFMYELLTKTLPNKYKYKLFKSCPIPYWEFIWARSRVRALRAIYKSNSLNKCKYSFPIDIDIPISFVHCLAENDFCRYYGC